MRAFKRHQANERSVLVDIMCNKYIRPKDGCHRKKRGFGLRKKDRPWGDPVLRKSTAIYNKTRSQSPPNAGPSFSSPQPLRGRVEGRVRGGLSSPFQTPPPLHSPQLQHLHRHHAARPAPLEAHKAQPGSDYPGSACLEFCSRGSGLLLH